MDFIKLREIVENKGCKLCWTEEDFKEKYKNHKTNIDIISSCGHPKNVQFSNFRYLDTGVICNECGYIKKSIDNKNNPIDANLKEYECIKILEDKLKPYFILKKLKEGTLADIAIKPIEQNEDKWLPIQIKSREKECHRKYSFHIHNSINHYKNMYILLFVFENKKIWLLNGNDIKVKNINIGVKKSVYDKFEVNIDNLHKTLLEKYNCDKNVFTKQLKELNVSISVQAENAHKFNEFREKLFSNLSFSYPEIDNRVYDCIINNKYKIQDKVITIHKKLKTNSKTEYRDLDYYICCLERTNKCMYELGDNDFYWFHLPDKKGGYIIPEKILYENNFISNKGVKIKAKQIDFYPYRINGLKTSKWKNEYLYFYDKDIKKIEELFD